MELNDDLFSRTREIVNPDVFCGKKVVVVGVGSGGGKWALSLAMSGVGWFVLIDPDKLGIENIIRHICGLKDLGRYKTEAVRDKILDHNPRARVDTHNFGILDDLDFFQELISDASLVLAGLDSEPGRHALNIKALAAGVPVVYAATFHRAFCGEVFRVIPGNGPCYACYTHFLERTGVAEETTSAIDYDDPELDEKLAISPGLGMDIEMVSLIAAKVSLITLLEGTEYEMPPYPGNYIFWGNRPMENGLVSRYFECRFWEVPRNEICKVCQLEQQVSAEACEQGYDGIISHVVTAEQPQSEEGGTTR